MTVLLLLLLLHSIVINSAALTTFALCRMSVMICCACLTNSTRNPVADLPVLSNTEESKGCAVVGVYLQAAAEES